MNVLHDAAPLGPRTPTEKHVADIVATLLNIEAIGMEENIFLLGGHSLLGAQIIARVADVFTVELSLRTLFDAPTVAALSAEIERLIVAKVEAMTDDEAQRLLLSTGGE